MNYIKFSHDYKKLEVEAFPTIRRYDRYELNEHIRVKTPTREFPAIILGKTKLRLKNIPDRFICYDTDTENREEALKVLNSFYRNPIVPDEILTILHLAKMQGSSRSKTNG